MQYLFLLVGLALLLISAEILVKGASNIALRLRISPLVVGMTIVSFGTSAPELFISIKAALLGHPGISIGNVVGSNIANIAMVLGITVLVFPILVDKNSKKIDLPIIIGTSLLLFVFIQNGLIDWWEGIILVILFIAFNFFLIRYSRKQNNSVEKIEEIEPSKPTWILILFIVFGCAGLAFGADWFLKGAEEIARNFGLSDHVIGVTLVAFGTSVPELITSVTAAFRKQTDISIGNLIGSNIFNILGVLGITSLIKEIAITPKIISNDIYWMIGVSLILVPLLLFGKKINWIGGIILVTVYVSYLYFVL